MRQTAGNGGERNRVRVRSGGLPARTLTAALLAAALFFGMPAPSPAIQILEAVDHAELEAEISDRAVSRIALAGDRIARVIRGPDGFEVEHDAARGDLYLRPADRSGTGSGGPREPLTLFIGTAAGFTYRLALTLAERGSAQILIRNAAAAPEPDAPHPRPGRVNALVALIDAVARREIPPGYAVETVSGTSGADGPVTLEIWRGPRFRVRVLEAGEGLGTDAESLAGRLAPGAAAIWLAPPGSGPSGGRLAVAVDDAPRPGPAGEPR